MSRSGSKTRVAIVVEYVLFGECLKVALDREGYDCKIVPVPEVPGTSVSLLTRIRRTHAEVVIINLDLGPLTDGGSLIEPIVCSGASVVAVTDDPDRGRWGEALLHGAGTVLSTNGSLDAITSAIGHIVDRVPVMTRDERRGLLRSYHQGSPERREHRARLGRLSTREGEILGHLMAGRPVADIAELCVVSEATVRTQVKSILRKLEVSSQMAAVGLAFNTEWRTMMSLP